MHTLHCIPVQSHGIPWSLKVELSFFAMVSHSVLFLFLLIEKLSLHNSSKYLVSTSVQLEPWFLFVAPGCGFSSFFVLLLLLLGSELIEGDACGMGTWYGRTAGCL